MVARGQENRDSSCQPLVLVASIKGGSTTHMFYNATADLALALAVALCEGSFTPSNNESRVVHNAKMKTKSRRQGVTVLD